MDMESIKLLLEQMLNQVQHQHIGQPDVVFEIIGKLEQLKAYFFTKAMHSTMFQGVPSFLPTQCPQPTPPIGAIGQQTNVLNQPMMAQTQAAGVIPPMDVEQPAQIHIQNQASIPQPAGPFATNPRLWQLVNEDLFEAVHPPVLWFSKLINSDKSRWVLDIPSQNLDAFIAQSPPMSYAQCSLFTGMTLPVTLYSRKLNSLFRGAPGLLVHEGGSNACICWPSVGKYFEGSSVVDVWYQWRVRGLRYMLIVKVDVQDPLRAGPSEIGPFGVNPSGAGPSGTGPFGAGSSGTGQSVQGNASKRPKH